MQEQVFNGKTTTKNITISNDKITTGQPPGPQGCVQGLVAHACHTGAWEPAVLIVNHTLHLMSRSIHGPDIIYLPIGYMDIPDVFNIKSISGNAHIWTYCFRLMTHTCKWIPSMFLCLHMEIHDVIKPISGNAHIWIYCISPLFQRDIAPLLTGL